jgi:hypothetical protein
MRPNRIAVMFVGAATIAGVGAGTAAAAAGHRPSHAKLVAMRANPAHNVTARPDYGICWTKKNSETCIKQELSAINHARAAEGVKPMVLPANFDTLNAARQSFVVTNLERTARGLRPFVAMVTQLNTRANEGARSGNDPSLGSWRVGSAEAWKYASNQASDLNALAADYDYMYNDGYSRSGGINADCQTPGASGCWVHRENILTHYPKLPLLIAGLAEVNRGQLESSAMIMVGARGRSPHKVFTWRQAKQHMR